MMRESGKWVRIDPQEYDFSHRETRGDVEIVVDVSSYDIPEGMRGRMDPDEGRFVIEFHYVHDEDTERDDLDEYLAIDRGRKSGRIYRILLDVQALNASTVSLSMRVAASKARVDALRDRLKTLPQGHRKGTNAAVIDRILAERGAEVLSLPA